MDLADQIETLHEQARGVFAQEFAKLSETRGTLTEVSTRVKAEAARQGEAMEREKKQIDDALDSLNRQIEANQEHQAHLSEEGARVARAVSRVVVALQSQDIIAQITQHLFEGIDRIRTLGRSDPSRLRTLVEMQRDRVSVRLNKCRARARL